jgi:tRNA pseudouridine38-40 synthase
MRRIRATLAYDGGAYHGWQIQPGLPTIQGTVESALSEIEETPVHVAGSGRTDAGVHALGQVAAFSIRNPIPLFNLKKALNRLLPPDIRVIRLEEVAPDFHPRYDAIAKTYEYRIFRGEVCSPFERRYVHHHPYPLDIERVVRLAGVFEGEHDFSAFAAADERDFEGHSKIRRIFSACASAEGDRLRLHFRGSGFLKHMVRLIAGTLLEAGKGNIDLERLNEFLSMPSGRKAGPALPAKGLFLVSVEYPAASGLPTANT